MFWSDLSGQRRLEGSLQGTVRAGIGNLAGLPVVCEEMHAPDLDRGMVTDGKAQVSVEYDDDRPPALPPWSSRRSTLLQLNGPRFSRTRVTACCPTSWLTGRGRYRSGVEPFRQFRAGRPVGRFRAQRSYQRMRWRMPGHSISPRSDHRAFGSTSFHLPFDDELRTLRSPGPALGDR